MTLHRKNPRRDATEKDVVAYLQAAGCAIVKHSGPGEPDLFVFYQGGAWLVEVKGRLGKLRPSQVQWREAWTGPPPVILRSVADAEQLVRYGPAGLT